MIKKYNVQKSPKRDTWFPNLPKFWTSLWYPSWLVNYPLTLYNPSPFIFLFWPGSCESQILLSCCQLIAFFSSPSFPPSLRDLVNLVCTFRGALLLASVTKLQELDLELYGAVRALKTEKSGFSLFFRGYWSSKVKNETSPRVLLHFQGDYGQCFFSIQNSWMCPHLIASFHASAPVPTVRLFCKCWEQNIHFACVRQNLATTKTFSINKWRKFEKFKEIVAFKQYCIFS